MFRMRRRGNRQGGMMFRNRGRCLNGTFQRDFEGPFRGPGRGFGRCLLGSQDQREFLLRKKAWLEERLAAIKERLESLA